MRLRTLRLGPPALAFVAARAALWAIAAASSVPAWRPETWCGGARICAVAGSGKELVWCAAAPGVLPDTWCASGCLPGHAALVALLAGSGLTKVAAAAIIAPLLHLATLFLLWNRLLLGAPWGRALAALALAAFFPGQIHHHAASPASQATLLLLAALLLLPRGRGLSAGLCGGLASATCASGVLLALPAGLAPIAAGIGAPAANRRRGAWAAGLTILGLAIVLTIHRAATGAWAAPFQGELRALGLHSPLAALASRWQALGTGRLGLASAPAVETLLVAALVPALLAATLLARRRDRDPADAGLALFAITFWLAPLVLGGALPLHRAEALLLPAAGLARHLPAPVGATVALAAALLAAAMAALFFRGALA